jgi:hypothetical protein
VKGDAQISARLPGSWAFVAGFAMPRASPISGVFQAGAGTYLLLGVVLALGALIRFSGVKRGWFVLVNSKPRGNAVLHRTFEG